VEATHGLKGLFTLNAEQCGRA